MENLSLSMRPNTLDDIFGQKVIVEELKLRQKSNTWPVASLLKGESGTGKTSISRIMAMSMVCQHPGPDNEPCLKCDNCQDILTSQFKRNVTRFESETAGSKASLVEELNTIGHGSIYPGKKVIIIEESDQLSSSAKNALHTALETYNPNIIQNVHFILISMVVDGLPKSIQNRCQIFNFKKPDLKDIALFIKKFMEKHFLDTGESLWEKAPEEFTTEGVFHLASNTGGSFRQALQILEKCVLSNNFSKKFISENLDIISYEDTRTILFRILSRDKGVVTTLLDSSFNFKDFFTYSHHVLVHASLSSLLPEDSLDWYEKQNVSILTTKNKGNLSMVLEIYRGFSGHGETWNKSLFLNYLFSSGVFEGANNRRVAIVG